MAVVSDVEIRLRADIARLQADMTAGRRAVEGATSGMARAADQAKAALAGIGLGLGLSEVIRMSDEYAKFTAQLKLATNSVREYTSAYADVKRIATDSQASLAATGTLYARIANGTRELGISQQKVADIVETVNTALKVSGATTQESESAILQLSQAFASGTLRGEEFNAVNEAAPRLMKALADGIGVPVGALKSMATEGKITSAIMAEVLPEALGKLRNEAKEIQTVSGAFVVLKNNLMEFTAMRAKDNGTISLFTKGIGLLSSNLAELMIVITTLTAVKIGTWAANWVTTTYGQIVANKALQASTLANAVTTTEAAAVITAARLAEAQAETRATAAAVALTTARVTELRTAVLAAEGAVALAIATNGLIPAQVRAAAAADAHAVSLAAQAVAGNAATTAAVASTAAVTAQAAAGTLAARAMGLLRGALAFLGGPIGALITVLGAAALAWQVFGKSAEDNTKRAAESFDEAQARIIKGLDEQISKNKQLIKLKDFGVSKTDAEKQLPILNQIAAANQRLIDIRKSEGEFSGKSNDQLYQARLETLKNINDLNTKMAEKERTDAAVSAQTTAERVKKIKEEYATKQEKMASEIKALDDIKGKTSEYDALVQRIRDKYKEKNPAEDTLKKEQTAYVALMTSIKEKIAADRLELSGYNELSESQKATVKLDTEIATGKNKLSASSIESARSAIKELASIEGQIKSKEALVKLNEDYSKGIALTTEAREKDIADAKEEAKRNAELLATFDMSAAAVARLEVARLEEQLAQRASMGLTVDEIAGLEELIAIKKESAGALATAENLKKEKDYWESIDKTAHDTFVSIADGGKGAAQRLKESFKNTFFDWLYQMTIKKWIINVGSSLDGSSAVSGITGSATAGGSILSGLSNAYSAITGGLTAAGGVGTGFIGSIVGGLNGAGVGSGLTSSLGLSIGSTVAETLGPTISSALSTGISGLATALPWVGGAVAIYSLAKAAFSRGPKEYAENSTLAGSLSGTSFAGDIATAYTQKGGWLRSDKNGVDKKAVDAALAASLGATYKSITDASAQYAKVLGLSADSIATRTQALSVTLGKDEAANQKAIQEFFVGVGDSIARELLPDIAAFSAEGESASTTLQRLVMDFQTVDALLQSLGSSSVKAFGDTGAAAISAREKLIALAGGLQNLATQMQYISENFVTQDAKMEAARRQVHETMTALAGLFSMFGYSAPKSIQDYTYIVQDLASSNALATDAGRQLYATLLALAPAFKSVTDYAAEMKAAANDRASATLDALGKAVEAQKNVVTAAYDKAMEVIEKRIDGLSDSISTLTSLSNSLKGALSGVDAPGSAAASRASATAQVAAALAIAKASGKLPSADSLADALATLRQDSSDQFASLAEYQRSVAQSNAAIEALGGLTDGQLSLAEQQLATLTAQKDAMAAANVAELARLDSLVTAAQAQINAVNGLNKSVLTVGQALIGLYYATGSLSGYTGISATQVTQDSAPSSTILDINALRSEMATLNERTEQMAASAARTADAVTQMAQQFNNVSGGGNALLTETA